jgi:hypothetical protein
MLFELPDPPPIKRAKTLRELDAESRPRWTRVHFKDRVPCDECIALLYEADGVGPYARSARWRLSRNNKSLLLCHEHADAWREELK